MQRSDLYKIIVVVLITAVVLLGGAYAFGAFEGLGGHGIGALIVGVTASLALGIGLMALMFASSRKHDEEAHRAAKKMFKDEGKEDT
jgi:hypothetical protein